MNTEKKYKAYISNTKESKAFDNVFGKTKENAISAIKRRHSLSWRQCCVWCVYIHENGQEEKV
jgi:hypothetical protein